MSAVCGPRLAALPVAAAPSPSVGVASARRGSDAPPSPLPIAAPSPPPVAASSLPGLFCRQSRLVVAVFRASTSAPSVAPSSYYSDALVTTPLTTLASSHTTPVPAASATVAHGLAAAAATPTLDSIYDETKVRVDCQQQQQQRKRKIDDVLLEAEGLLGAGRSEASASALAQDAGAGAGVARRPRLRRR